MSISEQNVIALNDQLAFISDLRTAVGSIVVLNALLSTSKKAWDDCSNFETNDHLILGIAVSPIKTDACNMYVSKLIKHYLTTQGARATAWTKNTIASENFTNKSIASIIAAHTFYDHTEMFKIVATRLMGFDDSLVKLAMAMGNAEQAKELVVYMASRFDMLESEEEIVKRYGFQIGFVHGMLDTGGLTEEWFMFKSQEAVLHYTTQPAEGDMHVYDHFDLLTQE